MALETIATAFVGIRPKADPDFQRELSNQLGPPLRRVAGDAARVFAGVKLAGFFRGGIDELSEAQRVLSQTRQTIRSTGGAANVTAGEVADLAGELSKLTGVDDELIQQGSNLLLTFKKVRNEVGAGNDIFDRATEAALDLSKAGFGSMESASIQLGKALNDPIAGMTALSRSGITFTAQQKEQIRTLTESGRVLEAQRIILAEVESQVGGVARAYGETLPGKLERGRNAMDEAKASLTVGLVPALEFGAEAAGVLADAVDGLPDGLQQVASIGLAAGGGILAFGRPLSDAIGFMRSFNAEGKGVVGTLKTIGKLGTVATVLGGVAFGLKELADAIGAEDLPTADLAALTSALVDFGRGSPVAGEAAKLLGTDLEELREDIRSIADPSLSGRALNTFASVEEGFGKLFTFGNVDLATPLDKARERIDLLDKSLADLAARDPEQAAASLAAITRVLTDQGIEADVLEGMLDDYKATLSELGLEEKITADNTNEAADATERHSRRLSDEKDNATKAQAAVEKLTQALAGYEDQVTGQLNANIDLEDAFDSLTVAVQEHGRSLAIENEDGRENLRLLGDLASGVLDVGRAYFEQTKDVEGTRRKIDELTERFKEHLRQLGFTKTQINDLVVQYGLVPERVETLLVANGSQALTEVQKVQTAFERLDEAVRRTGAISLGQLLNDPNFTPRQFGGPFRRGDDLIVSEVRPELVLFPRRSAFRAPSDGRVLSGLDTAALLGGAARAAPSRVFNIDSVSLVMPSASANPVAQIMREFEILEMAVG